MTDIVVGSGVEIRRDGKEVLGRSLTPPGADVKGKTCPGRISDSGVESGSARTRRVRVRSEALIPVVIPEAASTLTV